MEVFNRKRSKNDFEYGIKIVNTTIKLGIFHNYFLNVLTFYVKYGKIFP